MFYFLDKMMQLNSNNNNVTFSTSNMERSCSDKNYRMRQLFLIYIPSAVYCMEYKIAIAMCMSYSFRITYIFIVSIYLMNTSYLLIELDPPVLFIYPPNFV